MGALFSKAQETAESAVGKAQELVSPPNPKPAEVGVPPTNAPPQMPAPNSVVPPNKRATIATAASTAGPSVGGRRHTRRLKRSVIRRRRHRQKHTAHKR
jgi:hypothetical protein